jgi:hypothetical protein
MRPRRHVVAAIAAALVVLIVPTGRRSGIAKADDKVTLGGGAAITVNGTLCTLATIGHDNSGALVGFTAASCGGPDSPVVAGGGTPVGSVVAADDHLNYAVIKFDPAKVTPTANFAGFAINGIGPDPDIRQPVCTDGVATGTQCGHITTAPGPGPIRNMAGCPFQPGDEGRPVTFDNLLIGIARSGWTTLPGFAFPGRGNTPESFLNLFSAIMDDVNSKGGPGAGFSSIPA